MDYLTRIKDKGGFVHPEGNAARIITHLIREFGKNLSVEEDVGCTRINFANPDAVAEYNNLSRIATECAKSILPTGNWVIVLNKDEATK